MKQLIERIRELEAAATPGPWVTNGRGIYRPDADEYFLYGVIDTGDMPLIVEMRNALPQLLDRLEKLEAVAEAATDACRSIPGMLPKIEDALAALEDK